MRISHLSLLMACLLALVLAGCASPPAAAPREAIFYPAPPDQPRIQFLLSFDDADYWTTRKTSFSQWVTGDATQASPGRIANPYGVAAHEGRIYICDLGRGQVLVADLANRTRHILGSPQLIKNPVNITIAPDGSKYVCDTGRDKIIRFSPGDEHVSDLGDPQRCSPSDVALSQDGRELFVCDIRDGEVEVWSHSGELLRTISSKGFGPDQLRVPTNLAVGPDGNVYVVDTELQTVKVFTPEGRFLRTIGNPGDRPGNFARPKGIAISDEGHVYVADAQWEVLQIFNTEGRILLFFGHNAPGEARLGLPASLALDATSLPYLREYVAENFEPEYLLLVANQFGDNKISIYAFGKSTGPIAAASVPKDASEAAQATQADTVAPGDEPAAR